jgi:hypothetical protein
MEDGFGASEVFYQFSRFGRSQSRSKRQGQPLNNVRCGFSDGVWQDSAPALFTDLICDWADCSHPKAIPSREDVTEPVNNALLESKQE